VKKRLSAQASRLRLRAASLARVNAPLAVWYSHGYSPLSRALGSSPGVPACEVSLGALRRGTFNIEHWPPGDAPKQRTGRWQRQRQNGAHAALPLAGIYTGTSLNAPPGRVGRRAPCRVVCCMLHRVRGRPMVPRLTAATAHPGRARRRAYAAPGPPTAALTAGAGTRGRREKERP
jgi:hypothetical protein